MSSSLCLVTGACGFMGTHMVEILHQAGYRIRATDLPAAYEGDDPRAGRFPGVLKSLGVEFVPADLTVKETLRPVVEGAATVFHIAGLFSYSASWDLLYRVNVAGTENLLALLAASPAFQKIVVWGAGGIYRLPGRPEDLPLREDSPIEPASNYLRSKWEEEERVARFCFERGLRWSSIRPTTVYGPRAVYAGGQLFLDAMRMKRVVVPRNFNFKLPSVHVRDVCRAALHLAEHPETDGEAYNLNDDSRMGTAEFFERIAQEMGHEFRTLPAVPVRLFKMNLIFLAKLGRWRRRWFGGKRPRFEEDSLKYFGRDFVYSNEKLKKTGFQFEYPDFAVGLKETVAWYKANGWA